MSTILVVPDTQVKPGVDLSFLHWIGSYLVEKKPDIVVHLGDHWDFPSLSSYDYGKKCFEGRRLREDIDAGNKGMDILLAPLNEFNSRARKNKDKQYHPRLVFLTGNHCQRLHRAIEDDAKLDGMFGVQDLNLSDWEVHPFLEVVIIEGVAFSHYFTTGTMGRPATTATQLLAKKHMSCIAGHQQGRQIASAIRADGKTITAIICGSGYSHSEDFLGPQGNSHFRGIIMLYEVQDGSFDESFISLNFLEKRYGS